MITELEVTKSIDINIYEDYDCGDHYKYETNGKSYKYFNSTEVGESTYKVTFDKQGDNYYFLSSELYDEN